MVAERDSDPRLVGQRTALVVWRRVASPVFEARLIRSPGVKQASWHPAVVIYRLVVLALLAVPFIACGGGDTQAGKCSLATGAAKAYINSSTKDLTEWKTTKDETTRVDGLRQARLWARVVKDNPACFWPLKDRARADEVLAQAQP